MSHINTVQLGGLLRRIRKEKKLRLEDLSERGLSASTISKIERGENPNIEKMKRLCEKLGYTWDRMLKKLEEEKDVLKEEDEKLYIRLLAAHTLFEQLEHQQGLKRAYEVKLSQNSHFQIILPYFKGMAEMKKGNLEKATALFSDAIRLCREYPEGAYLNVESMSYRHLAYISYLHGKVEQALELVTQGLHTYIEHETRNYPKFRLLMDRVIYLETLKRYIDAFEEVCRIWSIRHEIPITRLRLELTDLYARGLCRKHQYKEAETLLKDAIYLARLDYDHDMGYILWTTVGELYTELGDIEEAKNCYQTAIALTKQVQNKKILPRTYRLLGSLYTKEQEWSLADQYLGEAIRLSKRHNNEREFLYSLKAAGKVYLFRKQYERAIRFFERALVMAKHSDEHEEILLLTARCAKHLNQNLYNNLIDRLFELRGML